MIVSNTFPVSRKYFISSLEGQRREIEQGEAAMSTKEIQTLGLLDTKLKREPAKGLLLGLSTTLIYKMNKRSLQNTPRPFKVLLSISGPVLLPVLFRIRSEYSMLNYLLFLKWKRITGSNKQDALVRE